MKAYYSSQHSRVSYDAELGAVEIAWFGAPEQEEFRNACLRVIDALRDEHTFKVLTDNSKAGVFSSEDQHWLNEVWLPKAYQAGYRVSATVVSNNPFVQYAVSNITRNRDKNKFAARSFKSKEDARQWLKEYRL